MSGWSTVVFTSKTRNLTFYCAESWQSRSKCKSQVQLVFLGLLAEAAVSLLGREKFELLEIEAPAVSLSMRLLWCFLTRLGLIYEAVVTFSARQLQAYWCSCCSLMGYEQLLVDNKVGCLNFSCLGHMADFHCQGHTGWLPLQGSCWVP